MGYHGCGDNYCVLGPPEKGTGTNGGCSCFDALLLRRGVLSLRAELAEVVIERSEADSCRRKEAERADAAEAEVERLRGELEVDRKAGKDQWLWANDSDEPTHNHRRNDSPQTPCELCQARAEIVRLRARLADPRLVAWRELEPEWRASAVETIEADATDNEVCCCEKKNPKKKCREMGRAHRAAAAVLEWAQEGGE